MPITNVGTGTQMIAHQTRACRSKTLPEFIAYAKANPGKLNFTVAGTQNISHLAPVLLFARAGINLVMVPAKSEPQAISDLISGQVDLYFGNSSSLLPHIDSDKIRLIAVGTAQAHYRPRRIFRLSPRRCRDSSSPPGTVFRRRRARRSRSSSAIRDEVTALCQERRKSPIG